MSTELVRDMAERMGRSGQEVSKALSAFASAINDRLQADGEANLAGLGTLRVTESGYTFEPSEALDQAVNYRWTPGDSGLPTGAGSIDVAPTRKAAEDDTLQLRKASWAPIGSVDPTDVSAPPQVPRKPAPPPAAPKPPAKPAPAPPPSFDPVGPLVDDLTYETLHQPVPPTPQAPAAAAPPPQKAPVRTPASVRRRAATPGQDSSNLALYGITAVVVLALIAFIWFDPLGWRGGDAAEANPPQTAEIVPGTETEQPEAGAENTGEEAVVEQPTGEDPTPTESIDPGTVAPAEPAEITPAAVSGGTIDPNSDGYTLIVGSSLDVDRARASLAAFSEMGHPTGVITYPDANGDMRHRIAVGQFATVAEADAVRRSLSGLPEGTWVRRIRR